MFILGRGFSSVKRREKKKCKTEEGEGGEVFKKVVASIDVVVPSGQLDFLYNCKNCPKKVMNYFYISSTHSLG